MKSGLRYLIIALMLVLLLNLAIPFFTDTSTLSALPSFDLQDPSNVAESISNTADEGTKSISSINKFLNEFKELIGTVIGLLATIGISIKRKKSDKSKIGSAETILQFIKDNAATMDQDKLENTVALMKKTLANVK